MATVKAKTITPADLYHFTIKGDGARRFKRLFCDVWNNIPELDRQKIEITWTRRIPAVTLDNKLVGACGVHSVERMCFSAKWFAYMPDDVARFVIGHELAHEYACSLNGHMPRHTSIDDYVANEGFVNKQARKWGFYITPFYKWCKQLHRQAKTDPQLARLIKAGTRQQANDDAQLEKRIAFNYGIKEAEQMYQTAYDAAICAGLTKGAATVAGLKAQGYELESGLTYEEIERDINNGQLECV